MMSNDIGSDLASQFLKAHEDYLDNPDNEKKMDFDNNSTGLKESEILQKAKTFTQDALEKRFDDDLANRKLSVLKPRLNTRVGK